MNSEPALFKRVVLWTAHCLTAGEREEKMKSEKEKKVDPGFPPPWVNLTRKA